jgi:hypothetical protein
MRETEHDYQGALVGNHYDRRMTGVFDSWESFKETHLGFSSKGFDDTYHFVFRYDIYKEDGKYQLELCMMLQRKGIYTHLWIDNIDQKTLDVEIKNWLKSRSEYMKDLWKEVLD